MSDLQTMNTTSFTPSEDGSHVLFCAGDQVGLEAREGSVMLIVMSAFHEGSAGLKIVSTATTILQLLDFLRENEDRIRAYVPTEGAGPQRPH